jgi:hypothetical protein
MPLDKILPQVFMGNRLDSIAEGDCIYTFTGYPLQIDLFFAFKSFGLPMLVFGQGNQDRSKRPLPCFQRISWTDHLNANVLILSDPTLRLDPSMSIGWCLGTSEFYATPILVELIKQFSVLSGAGQGSICFYGSSAGGFTSLVMSSMVDESSAFVNNPQTNVLEFRRGGVRKLLDVAFGGISLAEAMERYPNRFSFICHLESGMGRLRRTAYLQNICDQDHLDDQMLPFARSLGRLRDVGSLDLCLNNMITFELYNWPEGLHNPLGQQTILPRLKKFAGIN